MPTSATGRNRPRALAPPSRRRPPGFTLLEVLVVLAIVAVLASLAVLSTGGLASRGSERAAARAEALLRLACERAAATGRDVGIAVVEDGLRFGYLLPEGFRAVGNDPADPLRPRDLGGELQLSLVREGEPLALSDDPPGAAQLACLASGEMTPFELLVGAAGHRWRIVGRMDGSIARERDDAPR